MALQPKLAFKSVKSGNILKVRDVTGVYHGITNPGGYGTPNDDAINVLSTSLTITPPDSQVSYTITTVVASNTYPVTILQGVQFGVPAGQPIPDGIYDAVYVVTTSFGTYSYTTQFFITWNAECCLEKAMSEQSVPSQEDCGCGDSVSISKVETYFYLLWSARKSFYCGKLNKSKVLLDYVTQMCSNLNCTSC